MRSWQKKPPKGSSYPIRPSVLEAAITDAEITLTVELARIDSSKEEGFTASYAPPGSFPRGEVFQITCRSVPSERALAVRSVLKAEAIPRFIEWAKGIVALDHHSPLRREHQHFRWAYPNAKTFD